MIISETTFVQVSVLKDFRYFGVVRHNKQNKEAR